MPDGTSIVNDGRFDAEALGVILAPESWRIVSSLFDAEVAAVANRRHLAWMVSHVDRHPHREIMVGLRGHGLYGFQGKAYPYRPGTVFLFDACEPHDYYYPPGCPKAQILWMYVFENEIIVNIIDVAQGRVVQSRRLSLLLRDTAVAVLLIALWNELVDAPHLPNRIKRAKLVAGLAAILAHIAGEGYGRTDQPTGADFAAKVIQAIQQHVSRNDGRNIPLAIAARLAGYSKSHFFRLFKQHSGQTYHAYVNACRMRRARAMLGEGRRKKEIAEALGFSHPSAFLRWMKMADEVRP